MDDQYTDDFELEDTGDDLEDTGDDLELEDTGDDLELEDTGDTGTADDLDAEPVDGCDAWAGMVEVDDGQCAQLVTVEGAWVEAALLFAVLVLVAAGSLVVGQLRRG